MRLTIVGGGGFRVPLVHGEVLRRPDLGIDEVRLHDTDPARLDVMQAVLAGQRRAHGGRAPTLRATTDLAEAVAGTDVVFSAIRVGGLGGRVRDELSCLSRGVLGQETTGPGGLAYGLRTVPVALRLARTVAETAPDALVVSFTNPAGLVTEAMQGVLGDQVVGICDSPLGLAHRCARALGVPLDDLELDYAGLNHLGWLQGLRTADGVDLLPRLLADDALLDSFEEGALFDHTLLRVLGAVPNEYLHYWYDTREAIAAIRAAGPTRGEYLQRTQTAFYAQAAADPQGAWQLWQAVNRDRGETYMAETRTVERDAADVASGGYEGVALALMAAVRLDVPARLVLNVRNALGGSPAVPGLPDDAVVEVPCRLDAAGPHPLPVSPLPDASLGLCQQVKACERLVIRAAATQRTDLAVAALALHPLVDSVAVARQVVADALAPLPDAPGR